MSVNPTSRFSLSDPQTSSIAQEAERKGSPFRKNGKVEPQHFQDQDAGPGQPHQ